MQKEIITFEVNSDSSFGEDEEREHEQELPITVDRHRVYNLANSRDSFGSDDTLIVKMKRIKYDSSSTGIIDTSPLKYSPPSNDTNSITNIFQLTVALSSEIVNVRCEALKRFRFSEKNKKLFLSIIEDSLGNSQCSQIRFAATQALLTNFPDLSKADLVSLFGNVLKLAQGDSEPEIRLIALKVLDKFIESDKLISALFWNDIKSKLTPKSSDQERESDNFDILHKLVLNPPSSASKTSDYIFLILSFIGTTDTHRQNRLLAIKIIEKMPEVSQKVMLQSVKKDQIAKSGLKKKDSYISAATINNTSGIPLLCCGVFVHGIEDQFVNIRFNSLLSLFSCIKKLKSCDDYSPFIDIFLDALLDECDLVRLASLKLLRQMSSLKLDTSNGLESILAALDDTNSLIRLEALSFIGGTLKIASNSSTCFVESLLRIQRCFEAIVKKYPEMETETVLTAYNLSLRHKSDILDSNEMLAHLLQCSDPKYFIPSINLNNNTHIVLSTVHRIMQIPFQAKGQQKKNFVKVTSRLDVNKIESRYFEKIF